MKHDDNIRRALKLLTTGLVLAVLAFPMSQADTLEKLGCRAIETSNGREALDRLAEQKPALVLLDLMMPVMDGFEFLLEMRAEPEWQDIPVIVLTGKDLTLEDRRALSGRVEQIVEKGAASNEHVASLVHGLVQAGEGSGVRH